jgi:hypothetical protein
MFNTSTYVGVDGILTLSDQDAFDADTFTNYFGEGGAVGRVTNVTLYVSTDVKAFHELGAHAPKELRAGNIHISGTVERAFINGALLRLMLGQYAESEEAGTFKIPTFNMKLSLDNYTREGDEGNSVLTIYGVVFHTWNFKLPEDDFAVENLAFMARRVSVGDTPLAA